MNTCVHCIVSGRVQGVFYRASTQEKALNLGLSGWVRNMPDGRVELVACGAEQRLKQLKDWLWHGPANAQVNEVECKEAELLDSSGTFDVRI